MKKASNTNHITLSLNPDNPCSKDKVLVSTEHARLNNAIAPIGKGFSIIAMIVAINIMSKCQALISMPVGTSIFHVKQAKIIRAKIGKFFFQLSIVKWHSLIYR